MPIRATLMLADAAQAADGKLYILGGGWNLIGPEPSPTAIAMHFEVSSGPLEHETSVAP